MDREETNFSAKLFEAGIYLSEYVRALGWILPWFKVVEISDAGFGLGIGIFRHTWDDEKALLDKSDLEESYVRSHKNELPSDSRFAILGLFSEKNKGGALQNKDHVESWILIEVKDFRDAFQGWKIWIGQSQGVWNEYCCDRNQSGARK